MNILLHAILLGAGTGLVLIFFGWLVVYKLAEDMNPILMIITSTCICLAAALGFLTLVGAGSVISNGSAFVAFSATGIIVATIGLRILIKRKL